MFFRFSSWPNAECKRSSRRSSPLLQFYHTKSLLLALRTGVAGIITVRDKIVLIKNAKGEIQGVRVGRSPKFPWVSLSRVSPAMPSWSFVKSPRWALLAQV